MVFEREDFAAFPLDKATKRVWKPREHNLVAFVETVRRELEAGRAKVPSA